MESNDGDNGGGDGELSTAVIDLKTSTLGNRREDEVLDPGNNGQVESLCVGTNTTKVENNETAASITLPTAGAPIFIKSKPSREIYKPPNLRKTRSSYHGRPKTFTKNQRFASQDEESTADFKNSSLPLDNISCHEAQEHSELVNQKQYDSSGRENSKGHPWNVNAKEFQIQTQHGILVQRKSNWNQHHKNPYYYQSSMQQPPNINFVGGDFRLSQSKSSGSMFTQFQKYCYEQQQRQQQQYYDSIRQEEEQERNPSNNQSQSLNQPGGLQQSKSSGNVIGKSRVRFLEDNQSGIPKSETEIGNGGFGFDSLAWPPPPRPQTVVSLPLDQHFASLRIDGKSYGSTNGQSIGRTPAPAPQLQKSKSMLYKQFEPMKVNFKGQGSWNTTSSRVTPEGRNPSTLIRRSKSFGYSNSVPFHAESVGVTSGQGQGHAQYTWNDFEMSKWPKGVVESVKTAINGVERVPARHKIDMVTRIFGTMLGDYNVDLVLTPDEHGPLQGQNDFIRPAVHIFLYFIQKEKDQTVMESLLNNCLATYQSLFQSSGIVTPSPNVTKRNSRGQLLLISCSTTTKWIIFLQFLSLFYQKGKAIRLRKNDSGKCLLEGFSHHFLSLLCDSCLIVLRLSPVSYTAELMDTLFVVMTSLGSDMEMTFPWKMKQILAGVRDVLLGVNSSEQSLSPYIQKTLMQLIELHAANWQLPASAVRYYYSSTPSFNQIRPKT